MSNQYLSPGVYAREAQPTRRAFDPVQTSVAGFVGVTERGPFTPTEVVGFDEFERIFGGFITDSELPQSVLAFFLGGGQRAIITRVVHYTDVLDPATKTSAAATLNLLTASGAPTAAVIDGTNPGPFDFEPGDQVAIDVDGGGAVLATFDAAPGAQTSVNSEDYVLADLQTLDVSVDGGLAQTITFLTAEFANIALAKSAEVAAVINAKISGAFASGAGGVVTITSDTRGTASSVEITGGTAAAAFAFPAGAAVGTGDVADIDAVTGAEVKTVVEADVPGTTVTVLGSGAVRLESNTTGPASTLQVASSAIQIALGWTTATVSGTSGAAAPTVQIDGKTDGEYANTLQVRIEDATNGDAEFFNLSVEDNGLVLERFANLTMDPLNSGFVEAALTASDYISATDLELAAADTRPANGLLGPLTGGDDGLVGLADTDFLGGRSANGATGLRVLDQTVTSILCVPGQTSAVLQNGIVEYCEVIRGGAIFGILDPPAGLNEDEVVTHFKATNALTGLSEFVITYWPRPLIINPDEVVFGNAANIAIPVSGAVAGRYAATDNLFPGGIYQSPAGDNERGQLRGVVGVEEPRVRERAVQDKVYPELINPITINDDGVVYINGTKTLRADSNFPRVAQRRGAIFIEQTIIKGLTPFLHFPNDQSLRIEVTRVVEQFLLSQLKIDAFRSKDPSTAYIVNFGEALNPPDKIEAGELNGKIGLAFATPADFIIIEFSRLSADSTI
jgi:phage tail sheath protein FI